MAQKLTAYGDKIVAKKVEVEAKSSAGIILPESAKEEAKLAEVVAVGKDVKEVKTGDKVVYSNYNNPVSIDGVEYVYMEEKDVYFKVG